MRSLTSAAPSHCGHSLLHVPRATDRRFFASPSLRDGRVAF